MWASIREQNTVSAKRHLNPSQFTFEPEAGEYVSSVYATHPAYGGGQVPVGSIHWHNATGMISNIMVDPQHHRQGIATNLYHEALKIRPDLVHSPESNRLKAGNNWVRKVGGPSL
jgi:GNAT superfamily N-acetyltransferase